MYSTRSGSLCLTLSCCAIITQSEAHTGRLGGALRIVGALSLWFWNAEPVLLLLAVIALTFEGLLLR